MDTIKRRILIIDDDVDLSQTIQYILEKDGGYHARVENDSTKTLSTIYQFRPELILLDVNMPNVNGYEICQHIKSDKIFHFIKIIFISGNVTKEQRLRGYEVGADDYMTKPFENDELLVKVGIFLKLKYAEEMNQIKSNILAVMKNDSPGLIDRIFNYRDFFKKKVSKGGYLMSVRMWEKLVRNKTNQVFNYAKNALFLCEIMKGISLSKKVVAIDDLITKAIHSVRRTARSKRISFSIQEKGKVEYGELDPGLMLRAFVCVLNNVIMHSPKRKEYILLIDCSKLDICEVYIQDSGHDIDSKSCDEVFNEFIEFTPQYNNRGQDLNIALARRITQLHRGDLSFRTNHEGNYFWVFKILFTKSPPAIDPNFY